jgi:hypothetical protein
MNCREKFEIFVGAVSCLHYYQREVVESLIRGRRGVLLDTFPGFEPPTLSLFGLANTPLEPQAFRRACEQFATFDASSSDDDFWRFALGGGPTLIVGLETELAGRKKPNGWPEYRQLAVSYAILSICWWESYLKLQHDRLESWQAERTQFDQFYTGALANAGAILGPPRLQGADVDEQRHRYALWRGETGLLILQQSAYDPQFGLDVNYWVQPWSALDPQPGSPFINWLFRLSPPKGH